MADLPNSPVTFLFTDIEGSTRLWEQHPEAMEAALGRHDAVVGAGVEQHGGTVIKSRGEGDSFFAVFPSASDAVVAACDIQRTLFALSWPTETPLRVRMALHAAAASRRDGDFYGPGVNRCARLRAVAHGGQVLLSGTVAAMVRHHLPARISLRDLGHHRLQDLQQPEHLFQLLHADLPADFPPPHSLSTPAHNLPAPLAGFVGREKEIADVKDRLAGTRLLTLTGAGGCGKTRLALQVAGELLTAYADGVWLVELAALSDAALVPQAIAAVLRVREAAGAEGRAPARSGGDGGPGPGGCSLVEMLAHTLRGRSMLLVLDNCEHLLPACARLADTLLRACPGLRILASSREPLGVAGELTYRVPSLSLPSSPPLPQAGPEWVAALGRYEAVQLFAHRAAFRQPAFALSGQNAAAVAEICRRLDGLPLAIELSAALVNALPIEQIAARLYDRFRLLTGGSRTALPRQHTLRATMDWSYDLLSGAEQALLRRLSVFAGAWSVEAAEAVCAGEDVEEGEVLPLLVRLVDKSLVLHEERQSAARYRLLETVRQYSRERLLQAGEAAALRTRHRDWFLQFAEQSAVGRRFDELEQEHDNLRAALEWSIEQRETEAGLRLGAALGLFWYYRGYMAEGWEHVADLLALAQSPGEQRAKLRATAMDAGAVLAGGLGDTEAARALSEESLVLWRELGESSFVAGSLALLASLALSQGDLERSHALYQESLAMRRESGSGVEVASSLLGLGHVARFRKEYETARSIYSESLALGRQLAEPMIVAWSLLNLGHTALGQGDLAEAGALLQESQAIWREQRNRLALTRCLEIAAQLAGARGQFARMALLFGAAEAQREAIRAPLPPVDRGDYDGTTTARAALGETAFASEWARGRALSLEQALDAAQWVGDELE